MSLTLRQRRAPAPYIVTPSGEWDGDDGEWSTFTIQVGNPPQSFRVLPASVGQEVWIPVDGACGGSLESISNCGDLRGVDRYQDEWSRGFLYDDSTSWNQLGPFGLALEPKTSDEEDVGMYGLDTVSLGEVPALKTRPELQEQIVAGVATSEVWIGRIGLGTQPVTFANTGKDMPSLLVSLRDQNLTTSLSYGYAVGKAYASPRIEGSLILGGYDQARLGSETVSVPIDPSINPQAIRMTLHGIVATNTINGSTQRLLGDSIMVNVNSAVTQLWLPENVCNYFEEAFGLLYDEDTGLYLVNNTMHEQLRDNNPRLTFTVGSVGEIDSTSIKLDYNALDLRVGIPRYNESTNYFPLRRAANESQYTLGRVFLQEAYMIVDWERNNFTIGQAATSIRDQNIILMFPPSASTTATSSSPSASISAETSNNTSEQDSKLSPGAIAGIVIAIIALLALALLCVSLRRRRAGRHNKQRSQPPDYQETYSEPKPLISEAPDYQSTTTAKAPRTHIADLGPIHELEGSGGFHRYNHGHQSRNGYKHNSSGSSERYEVQDSQVHELFDANSAGGRQELMSTPVMELESLDVGSEMDRTKTEGGLVGEDGVGLEREGATSPGLSSFGMPSPPISVEREGEGGGLGSPPVLSRLGSEEVVTGVSGMGGS